MKLKTKKVVIDGVEVEVAVLKDGQPVYVHDDGKEVPFDAPAAMAKIGELNAESKGHRLEAKAANDKLKVFEGIVDPEAAKKALAFAQSMEGKKVMDDEGIKTVVTNAIKPFEDKLREKDTLIQEKDTHIYRLEVSNRFSSSAFLKGKTIYGETPDVAEAYFGKNFKIEGGKVVASDAAGKQIYSVVKPGEPADFEEALEILVANHPKKDHILKAKGSSGSGAEGGQVYIGPVRSLADLHSPAEKSKFITDNGLDAFKALPAK